MLKWELLGVARSICTLALLYNRTETHLPDVCGWSRLYVQTRLDNVFCV